LLTRLLDLLRNQPNLKQGPLLEHWRDKPDAPHLFKLASLPLPIPENGIEKEFFGALQRLTEQHRKQETNKLLDKARTTSLSAEERDELKRLLGSADKE
jgi:DNA primase